MSERSVPRPPQPAPKLPLAPADIVLLEEADLYRYHNGGHVLHDTNPGYRQQRAASHNVGLPHPPVKYARSTHSYRSHRSQPTAQSYSLTDTPFAERSKRTASVDTIPVHYGAMRGGGPVSLFSQAYIGLLLNWFIVGIFNGAFSGLTVPLFSTYLGFSDAQKSATFSLFSFGWYFKFLFGFITDCFPINRQRRKPYIFIGWTILAGFMIAMACTNKVEVYKRNEKVVNQDAPTQGNRYVVPIVVSSFARIMATVACEGMMVEFAHREGEYDRGHTQLWCVIFRFTGEVVGGLFPALGLNSTDYGGSFASAMPLELFFASHAVIALIGNGITYFFLTDELMPATRQTFGSNLRRVWRFLEQRATTQVMVACFVVTLATSLAVQGTGAMFALWMHTDGLAISLVYIFQAVGLVLAAASMQVWFLNTNWRVMLVAGFAVASLFQLPVEVMTVWNVVRSSVLFLGKDWVGGVFEAFVWLISLVVIVEVTEPGLESMSYGLITTVCNLGTVVVASSNTFVAAGWSKESTDVGADTNTVRWHFTYQYLFKHIGRLALVLLALVIFPRQKRHVKEIKVRGAPNLVLPIVVVVIVGCLFVVAITSASLSLFKSTSCLKFAGGFGCDVDEEE